MQTTQPLLVTADSGTKVGKPAVRISSLFISGDMSVEAAK